MRKSSTQTSIHDDSRRTETDTIRTGNKKEVREQYHSPDGDTKKRRGHTTNTRKKEEKETARKIVFEIPKNTKSKGIRRLQNITRKGRDS